MIRAKLNGGRKFWLRDEQPWNIPSMSVTDSVFHPDISWLNDVQPQNISLMYTTNPVFQPDISPLNDVQRLNMRLHDPSLMKYPIVIYRR